MEETAGGDHCNTSKQGKGGVKLNELHFTIHKDLNDDFDFAACSNQFSTFPDPTTENPIRKCKENIEFFNDFSRLE